VIGLDVSSLLQQYCRHRIHGLVTFNPHTTTTAAAASTTTTASSSTIAIAIAPTTIRYNINNSSNNNNSSYSYSRSVGTKIPLLKVCNMTLASHF